MPKKTNKAIQAEILDVLDNIRFYIQKDGGDLKFLKFEKGIVHIQILGSCVNCALIDITYKDGVETILKEEIPQVKSVKIIQEANRTDKKQPYLQINKISPFKK